MMSLKKIRSDAFRQAKVEKALGQRKLDALKKVNERKYVNINSIMGCDWAVFIALLGGRKTGKSFQAQERAVKAIMDGKDMIFYNIYRTSNSMDMALGNGCKGLLEPIIYDKYIIQRGYELKRVKRCVYAVKYEEIENEKTGKIKRKEIDSKLLTTCISLSAADSDKQLAQYDANYKGKYIIILNEMNPGESEARRYSIVSAFVNQMENLIRDQSNNVKIFLLGNDMSEVSEIMTAFNFMPIDYGIYKLKKKKRCVIWYIKPTDAYKKMREGGVADLLGGNLREFSNEVELDMSLIHKGRIYKPTRVLKFGKHKTSWFTVWDGNVIRRYKNEKKTMYAMRRYIDETYYPEVVKQVIEMYDARYLTFQDITTKKLFQNELELLKKK